jgi:curved DNA-binding protein CbpA
MTNPYSVLGVSPNDDIQIIKQKYKQLALNMHPDRGGSEALFKMLQLSYAKILEEYKLKQIDKAFDQLKTEFEDFKVAQEQSNKNNINLKSYEDEDIHSGDFKKRFNKVFEENMQSSPYDKGYGKMMVNSTKTREDINISNTIDNFTIDKFNDVFNNSDSQNKKQLIKRSVPTPHSISKELSFTELGVNNINDFSGENKDTKGLHYMDYNIAHTTSKLIDKKYVKNRPQFKSVQEFEQHRDEPLKMSEEDEKAYSRYLKKHEIKLKKQAEIQLNMDKEISEHFQKVNQIMMQYKR